MMFDLKLRIKWLNLWKKKLKNNNNNIKHGLGCIDITVVDKDVKSKQLDQDQAHKMLPLIGACIVSSWSIRDLFKF